MSRWVTFGLFAVFLAGYTLQKYQAAAPPAFSADYLQVVLYIVLITAVLQFAVLWLAGSLIGDFRIYGLAMPVLAVALSSLGFVAFWYFNVSKYPNPPPWTELAPRGITPGLIIGAILVFGRWLSMRAATATPSS